MIVVVDSSIWISAIEFGGIPAAALELVLLTALKSKKRPFAFSH